MIRYEDDTRAIARAIAELSKDAVIDHGTARAIASQYNDGADTAVYSFVSTGAILDADGDLLWNRLTERGRYSGPDLDALNAYIIDRCQYDNGERIPGWSDMWVPKHVDYPHETGALDTCWCYSEDDEGSERSCGCGGTGVHGVDHED